MVDRPEQFDLTLEEYYTPRSANIKRIEESDKEYIGDFRLIYEKKSENDFVFVEIGTHSELYE